MDIGSITTEIREFPLFVNDCIMRVTKGYFMLMILHSLQIIPGICEKYAILLKYRERLAEFTPKKS